MSKKQPVSQQYSNNLKKTLEGLVQFLINQKPEDPIPHMLQYLEDKQGKGQKALTLEEKSELSQLRTKHAGLKNKLENKEESKQQKKAQGSSDSEGSDSECEEVAELPTQPTVSLGGAPKPKARQSVSAESFGRFNAKQAFTPTVIAKVPEVKQKIKTRLTQSFMFKALNDEELDVVVNAMDEAKFAPGDQVIKEGDAGAVLFLVEDGELDCYKLLDGKSEPTHLKVFTQGDAFGELALLYNAPRAATIKAKTDAHCWVLDRNTFNHIVKDASQKKREQYETFLSSVPILSSVDDYERSKICDSIKEENFSQGSTVITQGEEGNVFYIIISGEASANIAGKEVKQYKSGDYFGELALLRDTPRAATVVASTQLKCASIDRDSFKRLLGPLDDILKRNMEQYIKVAAE